MKKRVVLFVFLIIILCVSFVSAFSFGDFFKKVFGVEEVQYSPEPFCTDTDGHLKYPNNILTKGTVTTDKWTKTDFCINSTNLLEYFCYNKTGQASVGNCVAQGYSGCNDGKCVTSIEKKSFYFSNSLYLTNISSDGGLSIKLNGESYTLHSLLSKPNYRPLEGGSGEWAYNNKFNSFGSYNNSSDWIISSNIINSNTIELTGKTLIDNYNWTRRFTLLNDRILIHDIISNNRDNYSGFVISNRVIGNVNETEIRIGGKKKKCATPPFNCVSQSIIGENPSVYVPQQKSSLLIITRDDNLRTFLMGYSDLNHSHTSSMFTYTGLAATNPRLAFKPYEKREFDWEIYLQNNTDYFDLVNKLRKEWNLNRELDGQVAMISHYVFSQPSYNPLGCCMPLNPNNLNLRNQSNCATRYFPDGELWKVSEIAKYTGVKYLVISGGGNLFQVLEEPNPLKGSCNSSVNCSTLLQVYSYLTTRVKKAAPDLKISPYVNPIVYFNSSQRVQDRRFDSDKIILKNGIQRAVANYGWFFFYPTLNNIWGNRFQSSVNNALNIFDIDGIYIDEMTAWAGTGSNYWTYDVVNFSKAGNELGMDLAEDILLRDVSRLSSDNRENVINNILNQNKYVINNFLPVSERINRKAIFSFLETGNNINSIYGISYIVAGKGHFASSPIGLSRGGFGNELCYLRMNRTYLMDSVRINLENSLLTYYYHFAFDLVDKTPLPTTFMFPINITEINEGYVLGDKKLFTIKNGNFNLQKATNGKILYFDKDGHLITTKTRLFSGNIISINNIGDKEVVMAIDNSVLDYDLDGFNANLDCNDMDERARFGIAGAIENCSNAVDDNCNGFIDCEEDSCNNRICGINKTCMAKNCTRIIDTALPIISIISPLNKIYDTTTIFFSVGLNENGTWCGFSLDNSSNITMTRFNSTYFNFTNNTMTQGNHNIIFSCNDSSGNMNSSSEIKTFGVDTIPPVFTNLINHTLVFGQSLNYDIDASDINGISCFKINNTAKFSINCSGFLKNITLLSPAIYWINVIVNDTLNNINSKVIYINITLLPDTTPPQITIISPQEIFYQTSKIYFNFSLNEAGYCGYSLDNGRTNYTMTANLSRTGFNSTRNIADGNYIARAYCNDSAGNWNLTTSKSFSVTKLCNPGERKCSGNILQICDNDGSGWINLQTCSAATPYCSSGICVQCILNSHCNNGLFCDGAEICSTNLSCQRGAPPLINDSIECTVDSCDELNDRIIHAPDNSLCDNRLFCDGAEICSSGIGCQSGMSVICNDAISCTSDLCNNTLNSCQFTPIDNDRDNFNICPGPDLDCNDTNFNINPNAIEICADNIDNDCNTFQDCADSICNSDPLCRIICSSKLDCGLDGLIGSVFCDGELNQINRTWNCANPGTINSRCDYIDRELMIQNCSLEDEIGEWESDFCFENSIIRKRNITEGYCNFGNCLSVTSTETEIIENCAEENRICSGAECVELDSDSDGIPDSMDKCPQTELNKIVGLNGCVLPNSGKFSQRLTTDFNNPNYDLREMRIFSIGIEENGTIIFVNNSYYIEEVDFDSSIDINRNSISVNLTRLGFNENSSAILQFYGVTFIKPKLLIDNQSCINCQELSYVGGNYTIFVPHFSEFSLGEGEYCGDGNCNAGETCSSCQSDCGACPSGNGGGGGSGGGGGGSSNYCTQNNQCPSEYVCRDEKCVLYLSVCIPWDCSAWSICDTGIKKRICWKNEGCNINSTKPKETEICSCTENWICDEWSECSDRKQIKNCIDINGCGTIENREEVERGCRDNKRILFYIMVVLILILVVGGVIIGKKFLSKPDEEKVVKYKKKKIKGQKVNFIKIHSINVPFVSYWITWLLVKLLFADSIT